MSQTIREVLREAASFLTRKGIPSARLDAEIILAFLLNKERSFLYAHLDEFLTDKTGDFFKLIHKRVQGTPVAYITGEKEFFSRRFIVNPDVLIPRPETETLIEAALKLSVNLPGRVNILDMGTGSGAIAITLLLEIDGSAADAVDISTKALSVAARNSHLYKLEDRLHLLEGDLWQALPAAKQYNLVVSNPPYVSALEYKQLAREVKSEPRRALEAKEKGFEFYRRIINDLPYRLEKQAAVVFEVGWGQAAEVINTCRQSGLFTMIGSEADLAGIERVVWAVRE